MFLSCTSELRKYPEVFSFADAVKAAVDNVGDRIALDGVTGADVCVLLVGFRYGAPALDRPELSVVEHDFETASALGLSRLVFLLNEDVIGPARLFIDPEHGDHQFAFRRRLTESAAVVTISTPDELEHAVRLTLGDLPRARTFTRRVWNIPPRNPRFVRRQNVLDHLANSGGPRLLTGPGGMGKTAVAIEFAHRNSDRYDLAWLVRPGAGESARRSLADLAVALELVDPAVSTGRALEALRIYLRSRRNWLLIFDEVDDVDGIEAFLHLDGDVLVTSRRKLPGAFKHVEVNQFLRSESVELLRNRLPDLRLAQAEGIATAVADLPLALHAAAAYLEDTRMTPEEYLDKLRRGTEDLLATDDLLAIRVQAIIASALDRLAEESPSASLLLTAAAWLAPQAVPLYLFTKQAETLLPTPLGRAVTEPLELAETVSRLGNSSLVAVTPDSLTVHNMIRELLRRRSEDAEPQVGGWPAIVARLLRAALPDDPVAHPELWRDLLPHVLTATDKNRRLHEAVDHVIWLLDRAYRYLTHEGEHERAREVRDRATAWSRSRAAGEATRTLVDVERAYQRLSSGSPPDHPDVLAAASDLAAALQETGRYHEARQLYQRVLEARKVNLGETHRETLVAKANLAALLREIGEYHLARDHEASVAAWFLKLHGEDDPDTLTAETNLAVTLRELGEHQRAHRLDRSILKRSRRVFGEYHPRTLLAMTSFAADLVALGDYHEARALSEQAWERYRQVLGPDHPDTLVAATSLAAILSAQGEHERAFRVDEDTFTRYRRVLGDDHPHTLLSANNLAADLRELGRFEEAARLDRQTWERFRRVLGEDHPDTVRSAGNLALSLKARDESKRARS